MRNVVFVAPFFLQNTLKFANGIAKVPNVRLLGISQGPPPKDGPFADAAVVHNAQDPQQMADAVRQLQAKHGPIHRLTGILEDMQVQLAQVRELLHIEGPTVEITRKFRDKSHMKDCLRKAGLPCARHALVHNEAEAWAFAEQVGFPQVLKPPAGAGAKATIRVDNPAELQRALQSFRPSAQDPFLAEEFLKGSEHSFETLTVKGEPVFHSITHYLPTPLEAQQNPWIKWCVLAPRNIWVPEFDAIRDVGVRAVKAFGLQDGMTHMEWFRRPDGSVAIGEIAARPPGAQIVRLISECYQVDAHKAWARAVVDSAWDGPWDRKFAAGVAFLKSPGEGKVLDVSGLDEAQKRMGHLVVDARLPMKGQPKSTSYEGEGYVVIRHPETSVVEWALRQLISTVDVHYG